ncbi:hypothetical protein HYALB_00003362 [Hymenoscyphus albidus]|uniref:Uncharacterized protein n=1 Tax=Hymenoscyphus albidus TaxID=595503 RepID=A0A9N9LR44_9HELO|nr:hypothetical protein HYALB_00003362 [Hymenoscyphus albidus]
MAVSLHRSNMLGMQNIMSRLGPYIGLRPRSQLGANRGLPRHLSYDCCDCDITAGQHICQSCIVSQYGMDAGYYGCTCSLCDFCDDAYAGGYSGGFSGRGGAYGGGCYYDPRILGLGLLGLA